MISLKQLHYALAVQQTLHFKKAAEQCHISQSTLSNAITELEKQLQTQIFERNNKQVLVTEKGKLILQQAQQIKQQVEQLTQIAQQTQQPLTAPMRMGVIPTIGPYLLPKVLPKVRQLYPEFELMLIEEQSATLLDKLRQGDIDCAVLALPYPIEGLLNFDFWQENFYYICHKQLAPKQSTVISSQEINLSELMLLRHGHCFSDQALQVCHIVKRQNSFAGSSLHTLIQMVANKLGTTLVPQIALDQLTHNQSELVVLPLKEKGPHRTLSIITRPCYPQVNDVLLLKQIFTQQLAEYCTE